MSNLRWGIIAAVASVIISVALGIISDVRLLFIILRAVSFALVFFGIGFGARMIVNNLLPELLSLEEEPVIREKDQPGERVNITVGNAGEYAVPEMYNDSDPKELGNIEDLISGAFKPSAVAESLAGGGIDGKRENDYNMEGMGQDAPNLDSFDFQPAPPPPRSAAPAQQAFTPSFGDDVGVLPDLDAMAGAFSGGGESHIAVAQAQMANAGMMDPIDAQLFDDEPVEPASAAKPVSRAGNKPQEMKGDFNPKELAMGIRTVLSKEK